MTFVEYLDAIKTIFLDLEGKKAVKFLDKIKNKEHCDAAQIGLAILGLLVEHSLDYKI